MPFGHSPDVDLIALWSGAPVRVQVKTSVCQTGTLTRHTRHKVSLATRGGNQSWTGMVKRLDPDRYDVLFVVVGDGRRWMIPAQEIGTSATLTLGGSLFEEYEISPGEPLTEVVFGAGESSLESRATRGSAGVWRAGPACKVGALALSEFESHLPHVEPITREGKASQPPPVAVVRRGTWACGQTRVSGHRQIVIPKRAFEGARLNRGDRLKAFAIGPGEVVFRRVACENENGPP